MMNNKLYKKLVIAMMITTISAVAAASAADTTASVRPVDLAQAESIQARARQNSRKSRPKRPSSGRLPEPKPRLRKPPMLSALSTLRRNCAKNWLRKSLTMPLRALKRQLTSGQRIRKSIRSSSSAAYRPMALSTSTCPRPSRWPSITTGTSRTPSTP